MMGNYKYFRKGGNEMKFISIFLISLFALSFSVYGSFDFDLSKQDSGIISGIEGANLSLSADGKNVKDMILNRIGSERIMATIDGDTSLILDLGQKKQLDLNDNGENDVMITLTKIIGNLASFKLEKIIVDDDDLIVNVDENIVENLLSENLPDEIEDPVEKNQLDVSGLAKYGNWVIGIIVVVVILILIFVFRSGGDSDQLYSKATDLHREGQEFHWDGDDETAEELYDKASEMREKARNMEGGF
jgi:hypothetical protein